MATDDKIKSLQKTTQTLTYLVIVLIVAVGILFFKDSVRPNDSSSPNQAADEVAPTKAELFPILSSYPKLTKADHVRGNRKAKYVLIEYSDYECPFCKNFHETVITFLGSHRDMTWAYRHFPLDSLHQQARPEAMAAECVAKLGGEAAFWQFSDAIFETTPSNDGLDLTQLPGMAAEAGVAPDEFNNCYDNEITSARVDSDYQSGTKFGIQGTPGSFLINNQTKKAVNIPGALPLPQLEQAFRKIQ